jgi:hypothetical protein
MRTLSTATGTATTATITTPAFLVEIVWSTIVRLSSRGDQTWGGLAWTGGRLGKCDARDGGSVELINTDLAYSALVLNEGAADVGVRAWAFYGDNPGATDPVLIFDGVADGADIGADRVRLALAADNARTLYSPRRFIGPGIGANHLRPAGTRIAWGGEVYTLERAS